MPCMTAACAPSSARFDHDAPGFVEDACVKIAALRDAFGDSLLVGCGTAMTCEEVDAAVGAGAGMVVSPHADPAVIAHTRALGAVSLPGALTPTEIAAAHRAGADFVKLFPAGEMGLGYVRAVRAPLAHIPLFAVGGVQPQDVAAFLDAGVAGFGVGGPLVPPRPCRPAITPPSRPGRGVHRRDPHLEAAR